MYKDYNDEELINMVRENSEDAKDILFNKYSYIIDIEVKKYLYSASNLGYDYNDLYQDAMIGFVDAINSYREDKKASLPSFITICVDRKLQVSITKAGRLKNKMLNESLSLDHNYNESTTPLKDMISDNSKNDPLENILKEENFHELKESIEKTLSQNEYEIFELMIKGIKYNEIASITGKSLKQVDNTMQRIKSKIKTIIKALKNS